MFDQGGVPLSPDYFFGGAGGGVSVVLAGAAFSGGFTSGGFVSAGFGSSAGFVSPAGVVSAGLVSAGVVSAGLVSAGFVSAGLVSAGFASGAAPLGGGEKGLGGVFFFVSLPQPMQTIRPSTTINATRFFIAFPFADWNGSGRASQDHPARSLDHVLLIHLSPTSARQPGTGLH